jgi:hypothetical protein
MADYITGRGDGGHAIIIGLRYPYICAVLFDASGKLTEVRIRPLPFRARAMREGGPYLIEDPDFQDRYIAQAQIWGAELGFSEQSIVIERFAFPEFDLGIENLPRHMQHFRSNPDESSEEDKRELPKMIEEWIAEGNFVFWWGNDYYLDKEGEII